MKRTLVIVAAALAIAVSAGCATSSGTKIESSDLSYIQKGRTSRTDLVQKYGQPTEVVVDSSGKETLVWFHTVSRTDAKTFIPVAGMFIGGGSSETTVLKVMLDKRGIVNDYEYSGGRSTSKLNGG